MLRAVSGRAALAASVGGVAALLDRHHRRHCSEMKAEASSSSAAEMAARALPPPEILGTERAAAFACYRGTGERCAMSEVLKAAEKVDVVVVGETHDDPVAHQLELYMLVALHRQTNGQCRLSLEMFERDVQPVIDEYLAGCIRERDLLQDARPWANYEDYKPLVEFAKETGVAVVAADTAQR